MSEPTHTPTAAGSPRIIAWCAWHKDVADGVRLIQVDEQGSGAGGVRYACLDCITTHHLVPFADREAGR
ncbi:hypothetical protein [Streptomyces olivaceus]